MSVQFDSRLLSISDAPRVYALSNMDEERAVVEVQSQILFDKISQVTQ